MLDAFDVMLYSLVLAELVRAFGITLTTAGYLGSLTLVASALGGVVFGVVADRFGRTRALSLSILLYSVFTAACGLATSVTMLAVFRVLLGIGMGGEWASGAALVSETWPARHRGKALGLMQSCWAIGYGLAAVVTALVMPAFGWRAVFFVGVLPALLTFWIRQRVPEPEAWRAARRAAPVPATAAGAWSFLLGHRLGLTVVLTLMNAATMFAWWGFNLWIPAYLSLPVERGGMGLTTATMANFVIVMQIGMWLGYVTFGFVSDAFGRKPTYVVYLLAASGLMWAYAVSRDAADAVAARTVRGLLRHRLFQRIRRDHRGAVPDVGAGHRPGADLQHWADRQRRGAVRGRLAGHLAWLRRGALGRRGGVPGGRRVLDLDSRDARP